MLNALIAFSTVTWSEGNSWGPVTTSAPPGNSLLFTPEEPSTLALAIIGIGLVGGYLGLRRLLRPRRDATQPTRKATYIERTTFERPRRGAA